MRSSPSMSDILDCTDFDDMVTTSPPPATNGFTTNGVTTNGTSHISHAPYNTQTTPPPTKPTILHLGAPIRYNLDLYDRLQSHFHFIRPEPADLERQKFTGHLRAGTWGNFSAIIKPFWSTGCEMHPWDRELIDLLPSSMQIMAGAGAGFDWVDIDTLSSRGILYCNGAHASTESVTNYGLLHILSTFTHFPTSFLSARSHSPKAFTTAHTSIPQISHNPSSHTLGIVGLGNIGYSIATSARLALRMNIIYHDVFRKSPEQEQAIDARYFSSLQAMLPHCDCLLLATPSGSPIITLQTLALLPRGARVVNIARGSLVDEDALADALDSGHISAAGLDVHKREPHVHERLANRPNVFVTCHTGGASVETNIGFERLCLGNVERVLLRGERAETGVNEGMVEEAVRRRDCCGEGEGRAVNGCAEPEGKGDLVSALGDEERLEPLLLQRSREGVGNT